jgi:TatD DNase family protein
MTVVFADSHAHLDEPEMLPDREELLARARQAGVALIINVGIGYRNSQAAIRTAGRHPEVFATVGVHPHGVGALDPRKFTRLQDLADHPRVVAVGEIGLDFYRRRSPEDIQRHWFRQQLEWAWELKKPVVVHTREATPDTLAILTQQRHRLVGGVMHCFGGSLEEARAFLDLGFHLSFSGVLTYPKADPLREVARQVPLDRVLIETDCPYLTPQPWRGRRNEPAYVTAVAETLARLHGLPLAEVARQTFQNTLAVFGLGRAQVAACQPGGPPEPSPARPS